MKRNVTINFSDESPRRPGNVLVEVKKPYYGDEPTVVITQVLERTQQWESEGISNIYIPLSVLKELVAEL